jgi:hypothetical protein
MKKPKVGQKGHMLHPSYGQPIEVQLVNIQPSGYVTVIATQQSSGVYSSWTLFCKEEEVFWDMDYQDAPCECGSRKLGHPGHSYWCGADKDEEIV